MRNGCSDKAHEAIMVIAFILLVGFIALVILILYPTDGSKGTEALSFAGKIPTIEEIQKLVGVEQDGVIGPETIKAWKLAINQQYADRYSYMFEGVKK